MDSRIAGTSPELTAGAGFTFEDRVAAIYLTALVGRSGAAGLRGDEVIAVELQRAAFGQPMDDLIVTAALPDGSAARLALQAKRALTISAAGSNTDFRDVVAKAWATLGQVGFRFGVDRVGAVTGSIAETSKRATQTVCEWARVSPNAAEFEARFAPGAANDRHRRVRDAFHVVLTALDPLATLADLHRLFASFQLITFDLLHEGSTDEAHAVSLLRTYLAPVDAARSEDLFVRLTQIAQDSAGRAGQFTRSLLLARLRGQFRFEAAGQYQADLAKLADEARLALAEIDDRVEGLHLPREALSAQIEQALGANRFVQISGLPGAGKSVVLRGLVEAALTSGPVIFLKADRLQGKSWTAYAAALHLQTSRLSDLLTEVAAAGTRILFIDGLDRIEVEQRSIVNDILNLLAGAPGHEDWRVVASVRDNGLEPLRTWLSPRWLAGGAAVLDVKALDNTEATILAKARPQLRALLFGSARLRELTRRPFFLSVLARLPNVGAIATENDLIEAWWRGGGYNAPDDQTGDRQRALLALAWDGARTLGRRMSVSALAGTPLAALRADGIIREVRSGHTVAFSHDIYFEWAFLHLLIDRGETWPEVLSAVGEPPGLGRVIELLAQVYFLNPPTWADHLGRLEKLRLRSQWTRAWLLGPFGSPAFEDQAAQMTAAGFDGDQPRLTRLAVWFQAEKTRPNPRIVEQGAGADDVQFTLRMADLLAWPSDFEAWGRLIDWLVKHKDRIWPAATADVVSVFEVWQNALADLANPRSEAILQLAKEWLEDIEDRQYRRDTRTFDWGRWSGMIGDLDALEKRLRVLLLRAARAYPELVRGYLDQLQSHDRLASVAFENVLQYSRVLADTLAAELSDCVRSQVLDELPDEARARQLAENDPFVGYGDDTFAWHQLSIAHVGPFFTSPSPKQEPFRSLFQVAPDEARRLVADLCNHAITAWRQRHARGGHMTAHPIPLMLQFPWGERTFWGDAHVYLWFRGVWGPDAVTGALMALEAWALGQLESGRVLNEVLQETLEGHESAAALGIAVSLMLNARTTTPAGVPLIGSARLWGWDLKRWQHDRGHNPNMIAFATSHDSDGREALRASNALAFRQWSLRDLAVLFVVSADSLIREAAQNAIQAFEQNPPVDFAEELEDPERLAAAQRTALIWSRLGNPENYTVEPTSDGTAVVIAHTNPHQNDPDVVEAAERLRAMNDQAALQLWASDCFEKKGLSDRMPLEQALAGARALDQPDLFEQPREFGIRSMAQSAVAGVAAAALRFARLTSTDADWAWQTIRRAAFTPESPHELFFAGAVVPDHPCIYAARGLAAMVGAARHSKMARETLLRLALHPLELVSATVLSEAMGCWVLDRKFAWTAFDLGLRLSVGYPVERPSAYGYHHTSNRHAMEASYQVAVRRLKSRRADFTLPAPPAAWERSTSTDAAAPARPRGRRSPRGTGWREPETFLRWDFLPKVLRGVPIRQILADADYRAALLTLCEQLLDWTIQRLVPPWVDEQAPGQRDHRSTDILEWRRNLGQFLAEVGLVLPADEVRRRFLDPIFALEDELAHSLIAPIVDVTSAAGLLDPVVVAPSALPTLNGCADRILASGEWAKGRRSGGDLHGYNLPMIVRDVMFVAHLDAGGALRFANGDWREFGLISPIIERMTRRE
ncbi:MAG: hypothetical protein M0Z28_15420 [Rhodospirillales bacterium]|nr:hypothetical protein [Rhodospirillales bacterium]